MRVEVDQSGKVEWTQKPTVVALAGGAKFSLLASAQTKRTVLVEIARRRRDRSQTMHQLLFFATLLFLLLKDRINKLSLVVIDVEYEGHSATIKEHVLNLLRRHEIVIHPQTIDFRRIGKKSPAHDLALKVFKGKILPDKKVTVEEVLAEFGDKK